MHELMCQEKNEQGKKFKILQRYEKAFRTFFYYGRLVSQCETFNTTSNFHRIQHMATESCNAVILNRWAFPTSGKFHWCSGKLSLVWCSGKLS